MKTAFTMIELIFVIVILGILAAVAIPKLTATRDDAEVSKVTQNIMTSVSEIAAYAMSQSKVNADLSKMSNVISELVSHGDAVLDTSNQNATIKVRGNDCVTVEVDSNSTTDTLIVVFDTTNSESVCAAVQSRIDGSQYPMRLRGQYVTY
jgi:prepilin-type N-terminal cleavage/methylation domain-containing protein